MFSHDEIAGIVDLFGALTREQAVEALSELAYRRGSDPPDGAIDDAIEAFVLVEFDADGERLVAPGPAAFPELPAGSEDLPHILDTENRSIDHGTIGRAATERLRTEADRAVAADDRDRAADLIDISYDLEAWTDVDLTALREKLDTVADDTN